MKKFLAILLTAVLMLTFASFPAFAATATLIEFPEYPDELPRNYDYEVSVSNGSKTINLPVYNASRQQNNYVSMEKGTDDYRRFCEFGFDGGEVIVSVTVKGEMSSYALLPSSLGLASSVSGNTISFKLSSPTDVVLRLNDDQNTILSIFAYGPETDKPSEDDSQVIYFKAGLNNTTNPLFKLDEKGEFVIPNGYTVYLEPGALVTARLDTNVPSASATEPATANVKICGRGAFLDPRLNRYNDYTYMFNATYTKNIVIQDVKFLDAHCFNLCFTGVHNVDIKNVKILSSEISSDGISLWGGGDTAPARSHKNSDVVVEDCFFYCNDNVFVVTGANKETVDNVEYDGLTVRNCTVGTGFAILFPQGTITDWTIDNIDVFRVGDFFRATMTNVGDCTWNINASNIRAEDALITSAFMRTTNQGSGTKSVTFKNISLPALRMSAQSNMAGNNTTNLTVNCENVYINGAQLTETLYNDTSVFYKASVDGITLNCGTSFDASTAGVGLYSSAKKTASYAGDGTITVGGYTLPFAELDVETQNGVKYLPAKTILDILGVNATIDTDKITAKTPNGTITLTSDSASIYGYKNPNLDGMIYTENDVVMMPVSYLGDVFGFEYTLSGDDVSFNSVYNDQNLLQDGGFESLDSTYAVASNSSYASSTDWAHYNFGGMFKETDVVNSGTSAMRVQGSKNGVRGVAQNITDIIQQNGAGIYRFEIYARLGSDLNVWDTTLNQSVSCTVNNGFYFGLLNSNWQLSGPVMNTTQAVTLSENEWTKLTWEVEITDTTLDGYDRALFGICTVVPNDNYVANFYVDDAALYFTPAVSSGEELESLIAPEKEGMIFDGWYDQNGNAVTTSVNTFTAVTPKYIDLTEAMTGTLPKAEHDNTPVPKNAAYTNGLYLQGVQVRIGSNVTTGLRFITANNMDLLAALDEYNVEYGTLVIAKSKLNSGLLTYGVGKAVKADKIWHSSTALGANYQKYTACVRNISTENLQSDIVARPYIKYTDKSGIVRILYGEQYATNIYAAAKYAYDYGNETEEIKQSLWNEIINVFGIGDNDVQPEW